MDLTKHDGTMPEQLTVAERIQQQELQRAFYLLLSQAANLLTQGKNDRYLAFITYERNPLLKLRNREKDFLVVQSADIAHYEAIQEVLLNTFKLPPDDRDTRIRELERALREAFKYMTSGYGRTVIEKALKGEPVTPAADGGKVP